MSTLEAVLFSCREPKINKLLRLENSDQKLVCKSNVIVVSAFATVKINKETSFKMEVGSPEERAFMYYHSSY